jgi:hypothetical protein
MRMKQLTCVAVGALLAVLISAHSVWSQSRVNRASREYNPTINPNDFVPHISHKYFSLKPGMKFTYEKRTKKDVERAEVTVTSEMKSILGVTTTVVRKREWLNDQLIEDTRDWYAQDQEGNVWYFGEAVDNYRNGKIEDHEGSWEAGVKGAKPGIIMLKDPKVGDTYHQEYYKGVAEDMGTVVAVGKRVAVPYGVFEDCVQVKDTSPLDRSMLQHKYFCSGVGYVVTEEEGSERLQLVSVSRG